MFCLMQKFVDLKSLGNKLQMISAFAVEHVKGHIFVEADKQNDIIEVVNVAYILMKFSIGLPQIGGKIYSYR